MLDVHPPHAPTHTWKDFFIHIATIVIGLLIAIGLEQTVEWLHHKSEVRETRGLLKEEREQNVNAFHRNVAHARQLRATLENDLRVFRFLEQHPGAPPAKLPGMIVWQERQTVYAQASWSSAKQANVLALMPRSEVEDSRSLYDDLTQANETFSDTWTALNKADAYQFVQPDPTKLTREQVQEEIRLIQDCLRLVYVQSVKLNNIGAIFPDFAPGPSRAELSNFHHLDLQQADRLPSAYAFTKHDSDEATALDIADEPHILFTKEISERGTARLAESYEAFRAEHPGFKLSEDQVNGWGLQRMTVAEDLPGAIAILKLNVQLYPDSWNVYDSLGEAYAKAGDKKLAIENYQHAHQLNPANPSPIEALAKLQK